MINKEIMWRMLVSMLVVAILLLPAIFHGSVLSSTEDNSDNASGAYLQSPELQQIPPPEPEPVPQPEPEPVTTPEPEPEPTPPGNPGGGGCCGGGTPTGGSSEGGSTGGGGGGCCGAPTTPMSYTMPPGTSPPSPPSPLTPLGVNVAGLPTFTQDLLILELGPGGAGGGGGGR